MLKVEKPRPGVFSQLKKVGKNRKISLRTKNRILEATVMTVVKCGSEACAFRKTDKDLLDVFYTNCLRIVLGNRLTDRISNSRLYEKCGSILLSRDIVREKLKWLDYVLRMKGDRLSFSANRLGLNGKQVVLSWCGKMSQGKI
ncbi:uncharacterized protein LOC136029671 [Artemia franciscana]|uniref:uncharacterized protein LOC136029671 n=1 Tax=Artemia franciscana TaxID=6661 RepID=UPI0032DAE9F2